MCVIENTQRELAAKRVEERALLTTFLHEAGWLIAGLLVLLIGGVGFRMPIPFIIGLLAFIVRMLSWHRRLWTDRK